MGRKFYLFFLTKIEKMEAKTFVFHVVALDPIKIYTRLAPQNHHHQFCESF